MKDAWLKLRSAILWAISLVHFAVVCSFLVFLGIFIDPRKNDWPQRVFFRNILRLAGVKFEVRRSADFDPAATSIFVSNHVNLFDPFVIYSAIPQFVRGFELASHFKIPVYGWLMGRFGNVPVPDTKSRDGLALMRRKAKESLGSGISLIAFAEGSRTRDGHVHRFHRGTLRIAQSFNVPIVPLSIVGSYQFFQTGNWMLYPGKIIVYLHDTISAQEVQNADLDELTERVHAIVAAPVEDSLNRGL